MPVENGRTPFDDPAADLLKAADIPLDEKAQLWDEFHAARSVSSFARALSDLGTELQLAQKLCVAKHESLKPSDTDKALAVLHHMSTMDRKVLDAAEAHPNVLKVIMSAKG